jgi:hypothetical protein
MRAAPKFARQAACQRAGLFAPCPRSPRARTSTGVYKIAVDFSGGIVELSLPQHGDLLRDGIRNRDIGLVFLDPMVSVVSAALDTHKDRETRMALEPMAIAMGTDSAVVSLVRQPHFAS